MTEMLNITPTFIFCLALLEFIIGTGVKTAHCSYGYQCFAENCDPSPLVEGYDNTELRTGLELFKKGEYSQALAQFDSFIAAHEKKAKEMQNSLTQYAWMTKEEVISYRDLNDVALALVLKGDALQKLLRGDEARAAYQKVHDEYYYGQCWCALGAFGKPAEDAQERLEKMKVDTSSSINCGKMGGKIILNPGGGVECPFGTEYLGRISLGIEGAICCK